MISNAKMDNNIVPALDKQDKLEVSMQGSPMHPPTCDHPKLNAQSLDPECWHEIIFDESCIVTGTGEEKKIIFDEPGMKIRQLNGDSPRLKRTLNEISNANESIAHSTSLSKRNDIINIEDHMPLAGNQVEASITLNCVGSSLPNGTINTSNAIALKANGATTRRDDFNLAPSANRSPSEVTVHNEGSSNTGGAIDESKISACQNNPSADQVMTQMSRVHTDTISQSIENRDHRQSNGLDESIFVEVRRCPSVIDLTSEADSQDLAENEAIFENCEVSLASKKKKILEEKAKPQISKASFARNQQCLLKPFPSEISMSTDLPIRLDETAELIVDTRDRIDLVTVPKSKQDLPFVKYRSGAQAMESFSESIKNSHVLSLEKFAGDTVARECHLDESNFISVINQRTQLGVPDGKIKNLVLKKRKRQVSEIEFDPMAWQVVDGQLSVRVNESYVDRARLYYEQLIVPVPESFKVDGANLDIWQELSSLTESQAEKSRRARSKTRQSSSKKATIRIGEKYQASISDHPSTYDPSRDSTDYSKGTVLWDPNQVSAALQQGEPIYEFLEKKDLELNVKYLLMESAHQSNYKIENAMQTFIGMYRRNKKRLVKFTAAEHDLFISDIAPRLLGTKKDFKAAAEAMNRTKETMLVHYYSWKRQQKDYARIKNDRSKEPDYCCMCDDGGELIICELCRRAFHLTCCSPPITKVPDGDWYCTRCVRTSPARLRRLSNGESLDTSARGGRNTNVSKPGVLFQPLTNGKPLDNSAQNACRTRTAMSAATSHSLFHEDDASAGASSVHVLEKCSRKSLRFAHKELKATNLADTSAAGAVEAYATNNIYDVSLTAPLIPSGMMWDNMKHVWSPCDMYRTLNHNVNARHEVTCPPQSSSPNKQPQHGKHDVVVEIDDDSSGKSTEHSRENSESSYSLDQSQDDSLDDDDNLEDIQQNKRKVQSIERDIKDVVASDIGTNTASRQRSTTTQRPIEIVYDAQVPITPEGLLLNISAHQEGGVCFSGYRRSSTGAQGPSEQLRVFRAVGDRFLFVDGQSCDGKSFAEVRSMLKDHWNGQRCKYVRMRNNVHTAVSSASQLSTSQYVNKVGLGNPGDVRQVVTGISTTNLSTIVAPPQSRSTLNTIPVPTPLQLPLSSNLQVGPTPWNLPHLNGTQPNLVPHQQTNTVVPQLAPHVPDSKLKEAQALSDALKPLKIPDLLDFLKRRGIATAGNFLNASSSDLATEWARERQVPWDVALDFMGAARLQVRQWVKQEGVHAPAL